ncbi:MAG TPA: hypothetical protein VK179_04795 [Bacteroidales bacterium]|nr:hypothetical protein [Bacteroidales bacterium]
MRKTSFILVLIVILVTVFVGSCEPVKDISDIPVVKFKKFDGPYRIVNGTVTYIGATLVFSFSDGNSDFGVDMTTHPADTNNFYMIPFQKLNGSYDSVDAEIYGRKYMIKKADKLDRDGEPIQGEISVDIQYLILPPFDTMKYEFYITDRAGNKSNVESTGDIGF